MLGVALVLGVLTAGLVWIIMMVWSAIDAYQVADGKGKIWT